MDFVGLDCLDIRPSVNYLRIDTSIDCNEQAYARFRIVCFFFVLFYLSVPFVWYALLYRLRDRLVVGVDPDYTQDARKIAIRARKSDGGLKSYAFLFHVCKYFPISRVPSTFIHSHALHTFTSCISISQIDQSATISSRLRCSDEFSL